MKRIVFLGIVLLMSGCIETGSGTTSDTIHSIEKSGLICPTWKVWLTNDHPTAPNLEGGKDATYSIDPRYREQIMPVLQQAKTENKKVTLNYRTEVVTLGCFDELHSGYAIIESATMN